MALIRSLQPDDRPAWLALWRAYLRFYETQIPEADTEVLWQRLLDCQQPLYGYLALNPDSQQALGLVHFLPHASTWRIRPVVYLQDLFVVPDARGRGIGRALIEEVNRWAQTHGACRVYWQTQSDNVTARSVYDALTGGPTGFIGYALDVESGVDV